MKRFITVSLLLVGLIVTCTARTIEADNNRLQGSSSSEESSEAKEFMQEMEACYEKTSSIWTLKFMSTSFVGVPICFKMYGVDLINSYRSQRANESPRHEFFPKYCPWTRSHMSCLDDPLVQELSKCLDDDNVALILNGVNKASLKALDMVCENDGEILFQKGASYDVCINNYSKYSIECGSLVSNSTNLLSVFKNGEAQCGMLSQVRDCMQRKFSECNGPRLIEVFDVFWSGVLMNSSCKNSITGANEIEEDKACEQAVYRSVYLYVNK